jgi:hypothetical protein
MSGSKVSVPGRRLGAGLERMRATLPKTAMRWDGLLHAARTAAASSGRSLVEQIEFWIRLGGRNEDAVRPPTAGKLLRMYPLPTARTQGGAVEEPASEAGGERGASAWSLGKTP